MRVQVIIYAVIPDKFDLTADDSKTELEKMIEDTLPRSLIGNPHEGQLIEWGGVTVRDA